MRARQYTISNKTPLDVEWADRWAWIKHDRCGVDPHYHYYLSFNNPRELDAIAKKLKIAKNFVEKVKSKKGILNYLTHQNDPAKTQYRQDEIHSNFTIEFEKNRKPIKYWDVVHMAQRLDLLQFCDTIQTEYEVQANLSSLNCLISIWRQSRKL